MKSKVPCDVRSLIEAVKAADLKSAFFLYGKNKNKKTPQAVNIDFKALQ